MLSFSHDDAELTNDRVCEEGDVEDALHTCSVKERHCYKSAWLESMAEDKAYEAETSVSDQESDEGKEVDRTWWISRRTCDQKPCCGMTEPICDYVRTRSGDPLYAVFEIDRLRDPSTSRGMESECWLHR